MACNAEISTSTEHTISHKHGNRHRPIPDSVSNQKPRTHSGHASQDPDQRNIPALVGRREEGAKSKFIGLGRLGCVSSTPVSAPEVIRTAADWEARTKKVRRRSKVKKVVAARVGVSADVCCGPGIGFATDAALVDCVDSRRPVGPRTSYQRFKAARFPLPFEDVPIMNYRDAFNGVQVQPEVSNIRQLHRFHRRPPGGSVEIQMLERSPLGRIFGAHDRFGGWRLDVDSMSYEELVALGDRIGYVGRGLREEEIHMYIKKTKGYMLESLPLLESDNKDLGCSICQDEFSAEDEIGKMDCNHLYHMHCIKRWLLHKNACPVCKAEAKP